VNSFLEKTAHRRRQTNKTHVIAIGGFLFFLLSNNLPDRERMEPSQKDSQSDDAELENPRMGEKEACYESLKRAAGN